MQPSFDASTYPAAERLQRWHDCLGITLPEDSIVNARWPVSVTGFAMVFERIMNALFELWSELMPRRGVACAFNLEYLEIGGRDRRLPGQPIFMCYDYMPGGWGARNGRDGVSVSAPVFGVGLQVQPIEGLERLAPIRFLENDIITDSGGPGESRGGLSLRKTGVLTEAGPTVISYICDRERAITWGIRGGLPSCPQGLWLTRDGEDRACFLGAMFSNVEIGPGDVFSRPAAGGGGYGDPLMRDPALVCEDVADDYVSIARARRDYGVVIDVIDVIDAELARYAVEHAATAAERERIREARQGWLVEDPERIAARYRSGELDLYDLARHYGAIVDWGTGELLPRTTATYRRMLQRRAAGYW